MPGIEPEHAYDMMGPPVTLTGQPRRLSRAPDPIEGTVVHIQPPSGPASPKSRAVFMSAFSVLAGIAIAGAIWLLSVMFSVWGGKVETGLAVTIGVVGAIIGIAVSILTYLPWRKPMVVVIGSDTA